MAKQFTVTCDPIEVTGLHRPDPGWRHTDKKHHVHRWYVGDTPAKSEYDPMLSYTLPTLIWVVDVEETEEYPEEGHLECRSCRERVEPRYTADDYRRYTPGLQHFYIDDREVSKEEFEKEIGQERKRLMKICRRCHRRKSKLCFQKDYSRKDGLKIYCRSCRKHS